VIRSKCVLEPGVGGAGIHEEGMTDLPDVAKPLNSWGVESEQGGVIYADVVPERIADDVGKGGKGGKVGKGARVHTFGIFLE
jgi:hypothetical protein